MTDHDDRPLEQALREGFAQRADDLEIPTGMGRRGRTIARRRTARRAAAAATPVLAAVIVVVVLLVGGRSGPTIANAHDVIHNVRAELAQLGRSDGVLETVSGNEHDWSYTEPDGTTYTVMRFSDQRGNPAQVYWDVVRPLGNGEFSDTALKIIVSNRTWDRQRVIKDDETSDQPDITSTAQKISSALNSGTVAYQGKVTLDGRSALKLRLEPGDELYVDPHTYRPVEQINTFTEKGREVVVRSYLRPATAAHIAQAVRQPRVPMGYRRLSRTEAAEGTVTGSARALAGLTRCRPGEPAGRIIEFDAHSRVPGAALTVVQQYTDPQTGVCSTLALRYPSIGSQETDLAWQSGRPGRATEQVVVDKLSRTYRATTSARPVPSAAPLGIASTPAQVRQAIASGTATRGKTIKPPRGARELTLKVSPSATQRAVTLYVDPSTDAPVDEEVIYTSGGYRFGTVAYVDKTTPKAVSRIVTRPARPAGYTNTR